MLVQGRVALGIKSKAVDAGEGEAPKKIRVSTLCDASLKGPIMKAFEEYSRPNDSGMKVSCQVRNRPTAW